MTAVRQRDPARLTGQRFDLLIVGGGISGACLAWDASLRGLQVALVDQADFGAATSSATSKLIHGGLRYLKNGELRLVRESLRERRVLQTIAPHLVWPLPFLIPTYRRGNTKWMIKAGMLAYDVLSCDRNRRVDDEHHMPGHRSLAAGEVLELEPEVQAEGLTGGALYYDAQCNPDRLTWEFILAARELGAVCVNYARVRAVERIEGRLSRVEVVDREGGAAIEVTARMVANVAGPWADEVDALFGTGDQVELLRSKGIHIVTRPISRRHALVLRTALGRHFFVIPWRGLSLIGTTDTRYEGAVEDLAVTGQDVDEFLAEINEALPSAGLGPDDVRYRYAGVRPLVDQESQVYQASRKYEIVDHHRRGFPGLISAVGGKYTTSRHLAEKLCDRILVHLGWPAVACLTEKLRLPGAPPGRVADYRQALGEAHRGQVAPETLDHLVATYGTHCERVLELARDESELAEPVAEGRAEILAELVYAIEHEQARTLTDVLIRRMGLGTTGHPGQPALDRLAALAARKLGWDAERTEREKQIFSDKVLGQPERHFPQPVDDEPPSES